MRHRALLKMAMVLAGYFVIAYLFWILRQGSSHSSHHHLYNTAGHSVSSGDRMIDNDILMGKSTVRHVQLGNQDRNKLLVNNASENTHLVGEGKSRKFADIHEAIPIADDKSVYQVHYEQKPDLHNNTVRPNFTEDKGDNHTFLNQVHHYVCVQFLAGTGNRIFQFVNAYVTARKRNMTLVIPERLKRYSEAFVYPGDVVHDLSKCNGSVTVSHSKIGVYDKHVLEKIKGKQNVYLVGYFQSYKFFQNDGSYVRSVLTFRSEVLESAKIALQNIVGKINSHIDARNNSLLPYKKTFIGVHVRRGDKTDTSQVKAGYRTAPLQYILKALAIMKSRHSESVFVVVSDDIQWCMRNLGNTTDIHFVTGLGWPQSLAMLSLMNHTVMTVGTFGWWGAWLAGGDVIYYKDFLTPKSKMAANFKSGDFFPASWVGLS